LRSMLVFVLSLSLTPCRYGPRSWLAPVRARSSPRCAASSDSAVGFDEALQSMLAQADDTGSLEGAVDTWLDRLDENFIPMLAGRVEAAGLAESGLPDANAPREQELLQLLMQRSQQGFETGRDRLQELLDAGEINKMDARLCKMVKANQLDAGFLYVLFKNIEEARASDNTELERLLQHLHSRLQEELEKQTPPPLALLHKLTRTDDAGLRSNILRHYLVPQTSIRLPDGSEMPVQEGKAATSTVTPPAFASAIVETLEKIEQMPVERAVIVSTAEEIRTIAKEARAIIAESCSPAELESFSDSLTPAFSRLRA